MAHAKEITKIRTEETHRVVLESHPTTPEGSKEESEKYIASLHRRIEVLRMHISQIDKEQKIEKELISKQQEELNNSIKEKDNELLRKDQRIIEHLDEIMNLRKSVRDAEKTRKNLTKEIQEQLESEKSKSDELQKELKSCKEELEVSQKRIEQQKHQIDLLESEKCEMLNRMEQMSLDTKQEIKSINEKYESKIKENDKKHESQMKKTLDKHEKGMKDQQAIHRSDMNTFRDDALKMMKEIATKETEDKHTFNLKLDLTRPHRRDDFDKKLKLPSIPKNKCNTYR